MEFSSIVNLKPLSVNEAWTGKRFKTLKYKSFENQMLLLLPNKIFPKGEVSVTIHYGFSNPLSDIDNPTKMVLDILQKKYNINDRNIVELILTKSIVGKGKEYIKIFADSIF